MRPSRRLWLGALIVAFGLVAGTATSAVFVAHSAPAASKPAPFATVVRQAQPAHEPPAQLVPQILYSTPPPGLTPLPVTVTTTATPSATPTATPTATASPTASPTATPSATPTARPTSSATPTPGPTGTASATAAPHASVTATPGP